MDPEEFEKYFKEIKPMLKKHIEENRRAEKIKNIGKITKAKGMCKTCLKRGNAHWKDNGTLC